MAIQLLYFMLSFIGVMFLGPAVALLWGILFKIDAARLFAEHRMLVSIAIGCYGVLVTFLFFALQDYFFVFRPDAATAPLSKSVLLRRIEESFARPVEGQKLFDVARVGDRLVVTWDAALRYFQLTNVGGRGMKRVVVLSFDEARHRAYFIMKERDYKWSASLGSAEFSLNYATGIFTENRTEVYPSIDYSPEGGLRVEMKKLAYNSDELWQPLQKAVLGAGWSLHGGMVPGFWHRLLFALPMGLFFLAMGVFATTMAAIGQKAAMAPTEAPVAQVESPLSVQDLEAQLAQVIPSMKTEMLAVHITGIIKTPPQHLQDYARRGLVAYLNAYMRRPDRNEALQDEAVAFAARLKLGGVDAPARAQ